MPKPALGRGLSALLGGSPAKQQPPFAPAQPSSASTPEFPDAERVQTVPIDQIRRSPFQPRKEFPAEALQELADSIREQGVIQPLILRQRPDHLELIAGERRLRAAQLAGLSAVPAIVRQASDDQVLELALIENLQREDLNPIEEAHGYAQLIDQFQLRQEDVAAKVGKNRATVANALRLLRLPESLQAWLREGRLSTGHAKVLLGLDSPDQQIGAAQRILKDDLSVRQAEELVARLQEPAPAQTASTSGAAPAHRDPHVADLENKLRERFGTKVHLRYRQGKGSVEVRFFSQDDLERILRIIGVGTD